MFAAADLNDILISAVIALTGAVTFLFRLVMKSLAAATELTGRVGHLEGHQEGVQLIAAQALEAVLKVNACPFLEPVPSKVN